MKKWLLFLFVLSYVACKDGTQKVVHDGKVVNAVVREKKEWDRHVTFIDSIEILPPQISKFVPEGYLPLYCQRSAPPAPRPAGAAHGRPRSPRLGPPGRPRHVHPCRLH